MQPAPAPARRRNTGEDGREAELERRLAELEAANAALLRENAELRAAAGGACSPLLPSVRLPSVLRHLAPCRETTRMKNLRCLCSADLAAGNRGLAVRPGGGRPLTPHCIPALIPEDRHPVECAGPNLNRRCSGANGELDLGPPAGAEPGDGRGGRLEPLRERVGRPATHKGARTHIRTQPFCCPPMAATACRSSLRSLCWTTPRPSGW